MQSSVGLRKRSVAHHIDLYDGAGDIAQAETKDDVRIRRSGRDGSDGGTMRSPWSICSDGCIDATSVGTACSEKSGGEKDDAEKRFEDQAWAASFRSFRTVRGVAAYWKRECVFIKARLGFELGKAGLFALPAREQLVAGACHCWRSCGADGCPAGLERSVISVSVYTSCAVNVYAVCWVWFAINTIWTATRICTSSILSSREIELSRTSV